MSRSTDALSAGLSEFCLFESFSEEGLKEIIESNGCTPNNPPIDNYDFFHLACKNEKITEGILRCLVEHFPAAASAIHEGETIHQGETPLHVICFNKNATLGMVQLLIDASPDSLRHRDRVGLTPLHHLCFNRNADDEVKLEILKLLLEKCPESHADSFGRHPIHIAARFQSTIFCRMLIGAYLSLDPNTLTAVDGEGNTALHYACRGANYDIIELLLEKYDSTFFSRRNEHDKLPIEFLLESESVDDRDSIDYTQSVFQLIQSYPETVTHMMLTNRI